jgi:hypothetical protein
VHELVLVEAIQCSQDSAARAKSYECPILAAQTNLVLANTTGTQKRNEDDELAWKKEIERYRPVSVSKASIYWENKIEYSLGE